MDAQPDPTGPAIPHAADGPPETLLQLVYVSAARQHFEQSELETLLEGARATNTRLGVTGLLLFHEGSFIQVLEGPPDVVEALYARIETDPRHGGALVLSRGLVEERSFGEWRMGFVRPDPSLYARLGGLSDFLRTGQADESTSERVLRILLQFREGRWRRYVNGGR